jgi:hypothetical protein
MGEAKRKRSATQKLIAQFPDCCFCGGERPSATREHMPPTSLFDAAHRPDGFVMPACSECNRGTSTADLTVALISRWGTAIGTLQEQEDHAKLAKRLLVQAPFLRDEWFSIVGRPGESLRARQHLLRQGVNVPAEASLATIGPKTIAQLNLFAYKVVLGIYFNHFRRGLPKTGKVFAAWRTKEDFAKDGVPNIFFEMFAGYGTIAQGKWDERKTFEYRYPTKTVDGIFGCLARFRQGFFVYGFTADDLSLVDQADFSDWINPREFLSVSENGKRQS